ncbi:NAD(P)H-dependent oxidoreductase subunit E [Candidatus Zixiibacteriota bacterium]
MATGSLQTDQDERNTVAAILEAQRAGGTSDRINLVSVLEGIQEAYGFIPESALDALSEETGESFNSLYGLASFYRSFSFKPKGRHVVSICLGTACHVRKSPELVDEFSTELGVGPGETTGDNEFTLETVNCVGACALGPVAVIDGTYFPKLRRPKVKGILKNLLKDAVEVDLANDPRVFPVTVSCPHCGDSLMDSERLIDDHPSCRFTINHDGEEGDLWLSGLWGSPHVHLEMDVPDGSVTAFTCPGCHASLKASILCPKCEAPLVPLLLAEGGAASICSRRGCGEHLLDLEGTTLDSLMMKIDDR